ncbi:MAG TPA: hypothetical protein VN578_18090 [Candidatus Binatia bacterium]|nr:hypothetical protein [Candidatus Binatia bacterium]
MMIIYRSRFLARAEVWYDNEPDNARSVDWILYYQRSKPVPGATTRLIHTYVIDLTQSREQLLANLNKDTAYKIRRARERDKVTCECCSSRDPAVINQFERMYNIFAEMKGLAPLNRARIESMAAAGVLDMSVAKGPQGNALVYHANYRDHQRATSMELPSLYRKLSDSAERNFIGRASRYLTWSDILRFQEQGLKCFDFGGWYHGDDPSMLKINDFKRGFGGQVVRKYQCEQVLTLKGWIVLQTASLLKRTKLFPGRATEPAVSVQPELVHGQIPAPTD